jgi:hypothetical protein
MTASSLAGIARAAVCAILLAASTLPGDAQTRAPSANAVAIAKEIIALKGSNDMWDSILPGVVDRVKGMFLQTSPMLSKDINEVATKVQRDLTPRSEELSNEVARLYAYAFTEQELKDVLAFYKSPLGKKIIVEEPRVFEQGVVAMRSWTDKLGEEVIAKMRAEMKKKGHDL